jgi:mono/diheme cytochrome c family protein
MNGTYNRISPILLTLLLATLLGCRFDRPVVRHSQQAPRSPGWSYDAGGIISVSSGDEPSNQSSSGQADSLYSERCTTCHGSNGDGKGPSAEYMSPPPMNFHDIKWQKSVSDAQIAKAIVYGGASVGLSESMPGNPDLEHQPKVVTALVRYIRKLAR